jgi:uncharacterized protein YqjF (DUF2071 family)
MNTTSALDRLAMRARPDGQPAMRQNWENLLFLHWAVDPDLLRPLMPPDLELDTFDGKAWIGVTPFALTGLQLLSLPPVPGLDSFLEINVRTYVHYKGIPGLWFFSLDASKMIPALAARVLFALPYFQAEMKSSRSGESFRFDSKRAIEPAAHFHATWRTGLRLREPALHSLAFFLVERYCFFADVGDGFTMTRIYHSPWILEEATVSSLQSTMVGTLGLPEPSDAPLAHFSHSMHVEIWAPAPI